jgi:sugar phosphate isomerase/epimerase
MLVEGIHPGLSENFPAGKGGNSQMKTGIYTNAFREYPFEVAAKKIRDAGIDMIELGCGEESGFAHCNPEELLASESRLDAFRGCIADNGLEISALSCHGNPVSPNEATRELSVRSMKNAVLLAEKLGLRNINCFSGCPGDWEGASLANWVTVGWPMDYAQMYAWQWNEKLLPFWREFTAFAREHGIDRIGLELHPGQCCYNPRSLKRLREACGEEIGVNLDFSHLLWQRMDPILVIRELEGMIYHMHAKDIHLDEAMVRENGLINTAYFDEPRKRSWNFRSIGYGHGPEFWRNVFAELRRCGYDYVASIEMECEVLSIPDALPKAVKFLHDNLPMDEDPQEQSWQKKTHAGKVKRLQEYGWTE